MGQRFESFIWKKMHRTYIYHVLPSDIIKSTYHILTMRSPDYRICFQFKEQFSIFRNKKDVFKNNSDKNSNKFCDKG